MYIHTFVKDGQREAKRTLEGVKVHGQFRVVARQESKRELKIFISFTRIQCVFYNLGSWQEKTRSCLLQIHIYIYMYVYILHCDNLYCIGFMHLVFVYISYITNVVSSQKHQLLWIVVEVILTLVSWYGQLKPSTKYAADAHDEIDLHRLYSRETKAFEYNAMNVMYSTNIIISDSLISLLILHSRQNTNGTGDENSLFVQIYFV